MLFVCFGNFFLVAINLADHPQLGNEAKFLMN